MELMLVHPGPSRELTVTRLGRGTELVTRHGLGRERILTQQVAYLALGLGLKPAMVPWASGPMLHSILRMSAP